LLGRREKEERTKKKGGVTRNTAKKSPSREVAEGQDGNRNQKKAWRKFPRDQRSFRKNAGRNHIEKTFEERPLRSGSTGLLPESAQGKLDFKEDPEWGV